MQENGELRKLLIFGITEWFELTVARSCKMMLEMLKGFRHCPKVIENYEGF